MPRKKKPEMYVPQRRDRSAGVWLEAVQKMGGFVRVRGAGEGDPLHEFDVPVQTLWRHPERYTVVDPVPVAVARPMKAVDGVNAPDLTTDAPSEGDLEGGQDGS